MIPKPDLSPLLIALAAAVTATQAQSPSADSLPAPPPPMEPPGRPALPHGISPYAPPARAANPPDAAPVFAEWTRTAEPGDLILATGHRFTSLAGPEAGKETEFLVFAQTSPSDGQSIRAEAVRVDDQTAAFRLPAALRPNALYLVWPRNRDGWGRPAAVNRTEAWWIGPDPACRGETVHVHGRNLSRRGSDGPRPAAKDSFPPGVLPARPASGGRAPAWIYLVSPSGGRWIEPTAVNPYRVSFVVPPDTPNGRHDVWIHNGRGGAYGWSGPLAMTVDDGPGWTPVTVNVREHGAVGDGKTDDTEAIHKALQAARKAGPRSTLVFPAGTFLISRQIDPGPHVRWQGSGRDKTILRCSKEYRADSWGFIFTNGLENLEIRDLTLDAAGSLKGHVKAAAYLRSSRRVRLQGVRISARGYQIMDLHGSRLVSLHDCDFTGTHIFLGDASQVFIDRCRFRATNDSVALIIKWGGSEFSLTGCTAQDDDNSDPRSGDGWGTGRFYTGNGIWGCNRHEYIAGNVTRDMAPREGYGDQNSGEQLMWEGNGILWTGTPSASTATETVLPGLSTDLAGRYAAVISGRGLGQARRISRWDAQRRAITLEEPWNVPPDSSSVLAIGRYADRIVVYGNDLDGKPRVVDSPAHVASSGIQPFGGHFNFVADSNRLREVRSGLSNWGLAERGKGGEGLHPNFFSLYANNRVEKARWGASNHLGWWDAGTPPPGVALLGTLFRNTAFADVREPIRVQLWKDGGKAARLNAFDRCTADGKPMATRLD